MKRIGAALCAIILAFALVGAPAPVRADALTGSFAGQPLPVSSDPSDGLLLGYNSAGNLALYVSADPSNTSDIYAALYSPISGTTNYNSRVYASEVANQTVHWCYINVSSGVMQNSGTNAIAYQQDNLYVLYYENSNFSAGYNSSVAGFNTLSDALSGIRDYIDNPPVDPDPFYPGTVSLSLPAGNVGYVKVFDPDSLLTFTTTFNEYSSLFGASWPNITQTYNKGVQLPTIGTTFPLSGSVAMPWYKTGNLNLLGQSKQARCSITAGSDYVAIYNPVYRGVAQGANVQASEFYNNEITISATGVLDYQVFPIGESIGQSGLVGASDSNFEDKWTATIDPVTGVVTYQNQDGESSEPTYGGTTSLPGSQTTASLLERITDLLNSLVERVNSMFSAGHVAISGLVSAMENFAGTIMGLYAWLPADVLSVLNSSIILCLIIGVLKVFL